MARKKDRSTPPAERASMSGFTAPGSPARGPWLVDWIAPGDAVPSVNLLKREARLWNPPATWVEFHEGCHARFTPHRTPSEWAKDLSARTGVDVCADDINAAEDGRVNRLGLDALEELSPTAHAKTYAGLATVADAELIKKRATALLKMDNQREAARLLIAGLPHTLPLMPRYSRSRSELAVLGQKLHKELRAAGLTVEGTERLAAHIAGLPCRPPPKPPPPPPPRPESADADAGMRVEYRPPVLPPEGAAVPWGTLHIVHPKLTESVYDGSDALVRPSSEPGTAARFPERWRPYEGRFDIFARRHRERGSRTRLSVLYDASGSMSLTDEELLAVQERLPNTIFAVYAGRAAQGALIIIAEGGKRAVYDVQSLRKKYSEKYGFGGMNVVDGPALAWLGKQPGPRVWVSDGHVTGVGDRMDYVLKRHARTIVDACGITRVDDSAALFTWLDEHGFRKSAIKRLR